jgi:uncharacterized protein YjiK
MKKYCKPIIFVALISTLALVIYLLRLEAIGWYFWHNHQSDSDPDALNLKNYQVKIDGLAIDGLANASDLAYNPDTNTLLTVLNQESMLVELSLNGEILRMVHVNGVDDMEGLTHIKDNQYVIADERESRLIIIDLDNKSNKLDVKSSPTIKLGINDNGNKNFEGVSWDKHQKRLLVVKEREPKYVLSVKGFVNNIANGPLNLDVEKLNQYNNMVSWAMRDLSAISYLNKSGHMLLLSDESKLLKEFDENAKPIGALALWAGFHGLSRSIPQAEGVAIDNKNNIYIISEPNLFYMFSPR